MPRVATNGGILKTAIRLPTTAPTRVPIARPATTARAIGREGRFGKNALGPGTCAREADTMAHSATVEPTDRSIPLVMMAAIIPRPMMPIGATCTTTFNRFCVCRNRPSVMMLTTITKASRIRTIEYFLRASPKSRLGRAVVAVSDIEVSFARDDSVAAGGQMHDGLLVSLLAGQLTRDAALMHD